MKYGKTKRVILSSVLSTAFLSLSVCAGVAPTYTVANGDVLTVPGKKQTGSSAVNTCSYEITVVVEALGDATIKVTRPSGVESGALYFTPVATNGTLILDLTEWEGCQFRLDGGIITHPGGKLVVKGRNSLVVGYADGDVRSGFGDRSTDVLRNTSRPVAFGEVEFVDALGNEYDNTCGITLSGSFWDAGISPDAAGWNVAEGSVVVLDKSSAITDRKISNGCFDVDLFDLWVLNPAALDGMAKLRVSPGRNLRIVPRTIVSSAGRYYGWNGLSAAKSVFTNNVELLGEGACLTFAQHYSMTFTGDVTGTGVLRVALEFQNNYGNAADINGFINYSGPLEMMLASAATNYTLRLNRPQDLSKNAVVLSSGAILDLNFNSSQVHIHSVSNNAFNARLPAGVVSLRSTMKKLTVDEVSGSANFRGYSSFSNTVEIGSLTPGSFVGDNARVTVSPMETDVDYIRLLNPAGHVLYRLPDDEKTADFSLLDLSDEGEYVLTAAEGFTYVNPPSNVRIETPPQVAANVLVGIDTATLAVKESGSLNIGRMSEDGWKESAMLWLDPTKTDSWKYWTYNGNEGYNVSGTYKAVGPWGDWRDGKGGYYLISDKHFLDVGNAVCPFVVPHGLNGLPYMSFEYDGKRRRMLFYPAGITNSASSTGGQVEIEPKFVIMVFGSQSGGGAALLGNNNSYYQRGGEAAYNMSADKPVFGNGGISTWVDGEKVDPGKCSLNGGWQVISVDTSKAGVSGIGLLSDKNNTSGMGNQNYAEIIFFDKVLGDAERIAAERYLAVKWGLSANYRNPKKPIEVHLSGKGNVKLAADAKLGGAFSGVVDLNGHSLTFAEAALPPTSSSVASIGGRVAWFDPDDDSRVTYGSYDTVERVFDRSVDMAFSDGGICLDGVSRNPMPVVSARADGPVRRWLDYSATSYSGTYGRSCRVQRYKETSQLGVEPVVARTVFVVQDSSKGGGTPFMSTVGDTGELLSPRLTSYAAMPPDPAFPIWRAKSANTFAKGATYLNGRRVDGIKNGFGGRPELLTAVGGTDFPFGATGFCLYLEGLPVEVRPEAGEIHGEIMVYNKELPDEERQAIEAYLMYKWLGAVNPGYGVYTNLTLSGSGSVVFASAEQLPIFADGFTGEAQVNTESLAFTIERESGLVTGALDFADAVAEFPDECTLNVFASRVPEVGRYKLISSAGFSGQVNWRLNLQVQSGTLRNRSCKLVVEDGNVDLEVKPAGTVCVVR